MKKKLSFQDQKNYHENTGIDHLLKRNKNTGVFLVTGLVGILFVATLLFVLFNQQEKDSTQAPVFGITNEQPGDGNIQEFRGVSIEGPALPPEPESNTDTAIGKVAPTLKGFTFAGVPAEIKPSEKAKVLVLAAHWCSHCQKEIPLLSDWIKKNKANYPNVEFTLISTGASSARANFPPSEWLKDEKWPLPAFVDDNKGSAGTALGLTAYPYFVVLSPENTVLFRKSDEMSLNSFEALAKQAQESKK